MASGDLILMPQPGTWALGGGLVASGDVCALDRYEDLFDDFSIDNVNIGVGVAGGGLVRELTNLSMQSFANADMSYWYDKALLDLTKAEVFTIRMHEDNVNSVVWPVSVVEGAGAPAADTEARIEIVLLVSDKFRIRFPFTGGGFMYWNEVTGAWQAGQVFSNIIDYDTVYEYQLIKTKTGFFIRIRDLITGLYITDTTVAAEKPWTDIATIGGNPFYLLSGDYKTSTSLQRGNVMSYWKNYPLTAQLATMGQIAFNGIFRQFPITQNIDAGASLTWEYNKDGAGWITPGAGTPAEIDAALNGLYITTLDFRATLTSDTYGDALSSLDINGGAIGTEGTPLTATYNLPQEIVLEDEEIIIYEGCES